MAQAERAICERCGVTLVGYRTDDLNLTVGMAKTLHRPRCVGSRWRRRLIEWLTESAARWDLTELEQAVLGGRNA